MLTSTVKTTVRRPRRPQLLQFTPHYRRTYATVSESAGNHEDCDVVIVGGGPIGLAFANALASSSATSNSLTVTLIEAGDLKRVHNWNIGPDTFSNRVSSITNSSRRFLDETGCWKHLDQSRTASIEEMQVWDGISDSRIIFASEEAGMLDISTGLTSEMARLTENLNLQRALLRNLEGKSQIRILDNVKVDRIVSDRDEGAAWPLVHTSNGQVIRARLLVGADGPNSPVRSYAGIQSYGWAYDTRAIVATMFHPPRSFGQNTSAFQRFLPTGPIACLPLSPTASSLVWSTKPTLASALTTVDPAILSAMINAAFRLPEVSMRYLHQFILEAQARSTEVQPLSLDEVMKEIEWREQSHSIAPTSAYSSLTVRSQGIPPEDAEMLPPLVTSIQPGSVASFPLRFSHAENYTGEGNRGRTVLLGDAAHTVHPLAGQGLNLGLADADALASCIRQAVILGADIGSYTALQPYARARYFENHKILAATDKLHKLYSTTWEPIVWARSVGLEVINELDSVKAAIMGSAGASVSRGPISFDQPGASAWNMTAKGVEMFAGTVDAAKMVGQGLGQVAASKITDFLQAYNKK